MKILKSCLALALITGMISSCSDTGSNQVKESSDLDKRVDSIDRMDSTPTTDNETHETDVNDDARNFMKQAAIASTMEIELGKAAMSNSDNAKVKEFAAKMIADHTVAKSDLMKIAENAGVLLTNDYPSDVRTHIDEMKKAKGKAFDQHYVDMMVKDHSKTIALFKSATRVRDNEVKDYATNTLPVLEEHYRMATELKTSL